MDPGFDGFDEQLTELLMRIEWSTIDHICPRCWAPTRRGHYDNCQLDAVLTRFGYDTKDKRDEYRRRLAQKG